MCKELAQGADARLRPGIGGGIGIQVGEGGRHPGCLRSTRGAPWARRVTRAGPGGRVGGPGMVRSAYYVGSIPDSSRRPRASQDRARKKTVQFFTLCADGDTL